MFKKLENLCLFIFVLTPLLQFGNASVITTTVAPPNTAWSATESAGIPTTNTLASSNAPATITNDLESSNEEQRNVAAAATNYTTIFKTVKPEIRTATTSTATPTTTATTSTTTTAQSLLSFEYEQQQQQQQQHAHETGNEAKQLYPERASRNVQQEVGTVATKLMTTEVEATGKLATAVGTVKNAHTRIAEEADMPDINRMNSHLPKILNDELQFNRPATTVATAISGSSTSQPIESTEMANDGIVLQVQISEQEQAQQEQDQQPEAYQMQETLADSSDIIGRRIAEPMPSKINIVDLYPIKIEDFNPIIRDSNEKLLKERTIFTQPDDADEYRQNLMPNEVEFVASEQFETQLPSQSTIPKKVNHAMVTPTTKIPQTWQQQPQSHWDTISDFTGKVLAEQDGIITEIEQKFRLNDFQTETSELTTPATTTTTTMATTTTVAAATEPTAIPITTTTIVATTSTKAMASDNRYAFVGDTFIDRRVKKSFDFPMHRAASDVMSMPHIDFANTKFNMDNVAALGVNIENGQTARAATAVQPEFSTTKFYNSKELYNEMLLHNKRKLMNVGTVTAAAATTTTTTTATPTSQLLMDAQTSATKLKSSQSTDDLTNFADIRHEAAANVDAASEAGILQRIMLKPTLRTTVMTTATTTTPTTRTATTPTARVAGKTLATSTTTMETSTQTSIKPKKYQKELKRAKLLLKAVLPATNQSKQPALDIAGTAAQIIIERDNNKAQQVTTEVNSQADTSAKVKAAATIAQTTTTTSSFDETTIIEASTTSTLAPVAAAVDSLLSSVSLFSQQQQQQQQQLEQQQERISNPTNSVSKPIARPRILSRLQEKINSLECELQSVPPDSHLWRGNETHELLLPIVTTAHCENAHDCIPEVISWEGEAEIQSGDILIVEINDAILNPNEQNYTNSAAHAAQVYQVTRSGHEHCDVTEGILLDITPLVVDGRKLVTLYDKDLTEGVNLLIVVSELWGTQCVRLKVTTKTDNCGENAECSGKGICYSNPTMEEYECQCCSGFAGPHCEEIDACNPSPCTNNGICVDLSQGHEGNSYQCLCPYGYTGKNCQYESDPCNPAECMNGGSCVGNSTHFRCDCMAGFTGTLCQHSLNECESSPCVHGICVDQEDGFRCFCQPGFAGELCNFEYNECESNPCQNGGECIDHIGSYECRCTKGYTGNRCQIKIDFCANKPCPDGRQCIDHGNDFTCDCLEGGIGPDCNPILRTQCNVNPCTHSGTCWTSGDSFYCACRPGFTGTMCEDEFVVETVVSSSEFIVDDTSAHNFNDKTFGSSVVIKGPIELHNAYFAAGVLAAAIFIVAIVVTICHCKVNQTYRKFSTRTTSFFPILGFSRRPKMQGKLNKHWLSGKGLAGVGGNSGAGTVNGTLRSTASTRHLPQANAAQNQNNSTQNTHGLHERPFQRHLAMNLENDMYYTVDFAENSQHSPLIQ